VSTHLLASSRQVRAGPSTNTSMAAGREWTRFGLGQEELDGGGSEAKALEATRDRAHGEPGPEAEAEQQCAALRGAALGAREGGRKGWRGRGQRSGVRRTTLLLPS
jgi:hypothetical protein